MKDSDKRFIELMQSRGDACTCCDHSPGYSWCPICEKKTTRTDAYGGCFRCGESLVMKGQTGLVRSMGETDGEWKEHLAQHVKEMKK